MVQTTSTITELKNKYSELGREIANVILLGNVVNEVQSLNIDSPFVTFANVILLGNVVSEVQAQNI